MKGIILVAGNGTRLAPTTLAVSKPLLPVYDKPMIYYPLSTLIDAGIKDILIITNEKDKQKFETLLGDGKNLGINLSYTIQYEQKGIADAFIVGKDFIKNDSVCLILGDNLYCGNSVKEQTRKSAKLSSGAEIYGFMVEDPRRFGVAVFDENNNVVEVEEKPQNPRSNLAVTGLYFFDKNVSEIASKIKPSARGELEITDVINEYIKLGKCKLNALKEDVVWMDVGTFDSLCDAGNYVREYQKNNQYLGCIEKSAFDMGFINERDLLNLSKRQIKSQYGKYLESLALDKIEKEQTAVSIMEHFSNKNKTKTL